MTDSPCQTYTVVGLRMDIDFSELLIAGVLRGPAADSLVILASSEDDWTRWAMEFDAPSADIAAELARQHCANDTTWDD